jgi:uncharacterized protein YcgI (DUF1989 family)
MSIRRSFPDLVHPRYRLDQQWYDSRLATRTQFKLAEKFTIPPSNGRGFNCKAGQTFRVVTPEGPQVADVAFWNIHNAREYFRPEHTFDIEGWFISVYTRLWSDVPWFRPLVTCIEDTVVTNNRDEGWRHHFILGSHCTPEIYEMLTGRSGWNACHLNLLQAIEPFGLKEEDIHDNNVNVHQKMRIDPETGHMLLAPVDSKPGDYIEFYAEIDLLVGVSVCPNGDGVASEGTPDQATLHSIGIEIYDTGIEPKDFPKWTDWRPNWKGKWYPSQE